MPVLLIEDVLARPVETLACEGRAVDRDLNPTGGRCGRMIRARGDVRERARAAGWSVGGPPMCPACRRPDPAVARGLRLIGG